MSSLQVADNDATSGGATDDPSEDRSDAVWVVPGLGALPFIAVDTGPGRGNQEPEVPWLEMPGTDEETEALVASASGAPGASMGDLKSRCQAGLYRM